MFSLGDQISFMGLFRRIKRTDVSPLAINLNGRSPALAVSTDPQQFNLVIGFGRTLVLSVDRLRHITQIGNAIIRRVTIDVINHMLRPCTVKMQPRDPMHSVIFIINHYAKVAGGTFCLAHRSRYLIASLGSANKVPGFWVVIKQRAHMLCSQICIGHDAPLKLIGQGPADVTSIRGASHFIIEGA